MLYKRVEAEIVGPNPCVSCGACCAAFRASFYWTEGHDAAEGGVPVHLTVKVSTFCRAMRHDRSHNYRCIALHGTLVQTVECTIYERRPSACRDFEPSWKAGTQESSV